jgi:hypothetical protein
LSSGPRYWALAVCQSEGIDEAAEAEGLLQVGVVVAVKFPLRLGEELRGVLVALPAFREDLVEATKAHTAGGEVVLRRSRAAEGGAVVSG